MSLSHYIELVIQSSVFHFPILLSIWHGRRNERTVCGFKDVGMAVCWARVRRIEVEDMHENGVWTPAGFLRCVKLPDIGCQV